MKLHGYILLSHIGQNIPDPQRLALLLILLRGSLHGPWVHNMAALGFLPWSLRAVLHFLLVLVLVFLIVYKKQEE